MPAESESRLHVDAPVVRLPLTPPEIDALEVDAPSARVEALPAVRIPLWRDGLFWLALLLTLFAVMPFVLPGYFWGANDARHHVYFLFEYDRVVQDGIWYPRWSPDFAFGYGYPFFNIYGPLSHFLAELLLHFGNVAHTVAIESIFVLSIVASAAAMYLCARDWAGRGAALIAALVYTYLPYHLLNLYVRANLAESMAFVWLPLCLWAARNAIVRPAAQADAAVRSAVRWMIALAVAYGALMVTSNLVIVLFTPFLGLYVLLLAWIYRPATAGNASVGSQIWSALRTGMPAALGLLAGLGLSAFFWLAAFLERQYVLQTQWFDGRYDFRSNFVYFHQLFSTQWGFGVSQPGGDDPISLQIGVAALVLAVIGVLVTWRRAGRQRWEIAFFAGAASIAVLLTLQISAPLWELPIIGGILGAAQFPWRWFSAMAPFISLLAGLVAARFPHEVVDADDLEEEQPAPTAALTRHSQGLTLPLLALAAAVILASYPYLRVEITEPVEGPVSLAALMRFQQSADEMTGSTAWVSEVPRWSDMAQYYVDQAAAGGVVQPVTTKLDYANVDYENFAAHSVAHNTVMEEVYYLNRTGDEQALVFNHFYYPGWRAWLLDGEQGARVQELAIIPEATGTLGRMTIPVPPGEGYILLQYGTTPIRTAGAWITLATSVLLLAAGIGARWLARRRRVTQ